MVHCETDTMAALAHGQARLRSIVPPTPDQLQSGITSHVRCALDKTPCLFPRRICGSRANTRGNGGWGQIPRNTAVIFLVIRNMAWHHRMGPKKDTFRKPVCSFSREVRPCFRLSYHSPFSSKAPVLHTLYRSFTAGCTRQLPPIAKDLLQMNWSRPARDFNTKVPR